MLLRITLILMLTLGAGALGTIGWLASHQKPVAAAAVAPRQMQAVLVSAHALHAGGLLQPGDIAMHEFPADAVAAGALVDSPAARAAMVGALMRVSVPTGGLLLQPDMVLPGDHGYLAAVLSPGARAVSVAVDATTGNAGLIWPGDHVDLILTQTMDDPSLPPGRRMVAETVLSNVRVIATDQDLVRGEQPSNSTQATRTITLETTPAEAQRVSVASRMGHLSLSLCAVDGPAARQAATMAWSGDVSAALRAGTGGPGTDAAVHVFEGSNDGKEFRF